MATLLIPTYLLRANCHCPQTPPISVALIAFLVIVFSLRSPLVLFLLLNLNNSYCSSSHSAFVFAYHTVVLGSHPHRWLQHASFSCAAKNFSDTRRCLCFPDTAKQQASAHIAAFTVWYFTLSCTNAAKHTRILPIAKCVRVLVCVGCKFSILSAF